MNRRFFTLMACALLGVIGFGRTAVAQDYDTLEPMSHRHEVKVNLGLTILAKAPEIEYEYLLKPDMSVGGRVGLTLGEEGRLILGDFRALPYFRWYFTSDGETARRVARGFFAEVNSGLTSFSTAAKDLSPDVRKGAPISWGLGVGTGWKYVSRSGWTCDILYGIGRYFNKPFGHEYNAGIYMTGGLTVGKRF